MTPSHGQVQDCLASRFALPSWWVRAYEESVTQAQSQSDAVRKSLCSGLVPALGAHELNGLADILASLQQQILQGEALGHVVIDPRKHAKHASTTSRAKVSSFQRMAQDFAGLRLLPFAQTDLPSTSTLSFFGSETWERIPGGNCYRQLLGLASHSSELLLGMYDPYIDLLRVRRKEPHLRNLLGDKPPLILWRAAWLDLQGVSQALLLRLEKAMQWDFRWLQLEGIFGQSLGDLFYGLEIPKGRRQSEQTDSPLLMRLKQLDKLGRKLSDHGLLTFQVSDQYLALSADQERELSLVWQATQSRLHEAERAVYFEAVHRHLAHRVFGDRIKEMKDLFGAGYDVNITRELNDVQAHWNELSEDDSVAIEQVVIGEAHSHPIFMGPLFMEWMARKNRNHPLPLSADLRQCDLVKALDAPLSVQEKYANFSQTLMQQSALLHHLRTKPLASIGSDVSRDDKNLQAYIVGLQDLKKESQSTLRNFVSPKAPVEPPRRSIRQQQEDTPVYKNRLPNHARLKKIAFDELAAMKRGSGQRYQAIKDAYIRSLDEDRQKLINEVRVRLQPAIFDEQIKQGIVGYMIDNPHLWQSSLSADHLSPSLGL